MMARATAKAGHVLPENLSRIEALTGHNFSDIARLDRALTHASARNRSGKDYERLEFLGDRVLGLCVSHMLFEMYPDAAEGELSVRFNALVNADALAEISDELGLHDLIRTGADIVDLQSARRKNVRADVVESLIAALYLDGGLDAARAFITRYWHMRAKDSEGARRDAKTELQEWAHREHQVTPTYEVLGREGPDHEPLFTVRVTVGQLAPQTATGNSKRAAEQSAATVMLVHLNIWKIS